MKTSLIIPAYNEEKYIGKCLKSILSQSVLPDEIIVCDNNSTDNTANIVKEFSKNHRVKYVFEKQKGIKYAYEKAWQSATGDIIIRTDADCMFPNNWVKNIINHFKNDHNLCACGGKVLASDGSIIMKIGTVMAQPIQDIFYLLKNRHILLLGANFAIRREIFKKVNGLHPLNSHTIDDDMICNKLYKNKYKFKRFRDCWNLTSTRRFQKNPLEAIYGLISIFKPGFYHEKNN